MSAPRPVQSAAPERPLPTIEEAVALLRYVSNAEFRWKRCKERCCRRARRCTEAEVVCIEFKLPPSLEEEAARIARADAKTRAEFAALRAERPDILQRKAKARTARARTAGGEAYPPW